jgi:hypothetical protein
MKKKIKLNLLQRMQYTLEKNFGLQSGKYLGTPYEAFTKLRFEYNHTFKAGFLLQKDVGERQLYDHICGFIQWQDYGTGFKLILGNFNIHIGQGLVLSAPYSVPRSFSADAVMKQRRPNGFFCLSSNESVGFEGIFTGYNLGKVLSFAGFYSQKSRDAIIDEKSNHITDFKYDGYHRTLSELKTKNVLKENSYGGFIDISIYDKAHIGVSGIQAYYKPFIGSLNNLLTDRRNFYRFKGNSMAAYSLSYSIKMSGFTLSGEAASNRWKAISNQHSILITARNWQAGLKWWRLPVNYQTPFGNAFSSPKGEQGLYLALEGQLNDALGIYVYWFSEKKLWRTYFNPLPTQFREHYAQLSWKFKSSGYLLCQFYTSRRNAYADNITEAFQVFKKRIRLQLEKKVLKSLRLRTRIEKVCIKYSQFYSKTQGINIYQDLHWRLMRAMVFSIRFSSFDTENYESRIYEYEHDLPGMFSTSPLYGKGIKWYILCSFKLWDKIQIWIKYRNIHLYGVEVIGSGYSQIKGDTRQDIKFQIQLKY